MNQTHKHIYNCYLKNLRKDKPFRYRKDFSDLDEEIVLYLEKLQRFFDKYTHIKIEEFFEAPNFLHPDEKYPSLQYFISRAAIKTYKTYKSQKEDENPEKQVDTIKESLIFIGKFCLSNQIELKNYLNHKSGYMFSWINHYREHRITPYSIMELGNFENSLFSLSEEEKDIYTHNLVEKIESYKVRYHNSSKTKILVRESTKKIENFVKQHLQNKTSSATIKKYE